MGLNIGHILGGLASVASPIVGALVGGPAGAAGGSALGSAIGSSLGVAGDALTHSGDAQQQQKYALEQMAQQNAYNMQSQQNAQTFNRDERIASENFNAQQAQIGRDFSAQEAQKQRDFEVEMFNRENEYNSPSARMQRLIDAGINPIGAFGQDAIASAGQGVSAGASPVASSSPIGSSITNAGIAGTPSAFNFNASQARLANAQAQKLEDENAREKDKHPLDMAELAARVGLSEYDLKYLRPAELKKMDAEYNQINKSIDVMNSQIDVNGAMSRLYDAEGKLKEAEVNAFADRLLREIEQHNMNMAEGRARIQLSEKQARLCVQQTALALQQAALASEQTKGQIIQNGLNGIEFEIAERTKDAAIKCRFKQIEADRIVAASAEETAIHNQKVLETMDGDFILATEGVSRALGHLFGASVSINGSTVSKSVKK